MNAFKIIYMCGVRSNFIWVQIGKMYI